MSEGPKNKDWAKEAEKLLLSLRDIARASITLADDGGDVLEVNILAEGHRPPKQIVRDVRSALRAEYQIDLDYRKISIAQKRDGEAGVSAEGPTVLTLPASQVVYQPTNVRIRFHGVQLHSRPHGYKVRVELGLDDREAVGEASGSGGGRQVLRSIAEATLKALGVFLDPDYNLALSDLSVVALDGDEVVVAGLKLYKGRSEKTLAGSALVEDDLQQSVVYATLDGLNRILGRLRYREPVEYEIRPTSVL